MKHMVVWLLRLYRAAVSPYMPGMCRFQPTCSEYATDAVEAYGAFRGSVMAMRRLARCRPGRQGGFDPVPDQE